MLTSPNDSFSKTVVASLILTMVFPKLSLLFFKDDFCITVVDPSSWNTFFLVVIAPMIVDNEGHLCQIIA